MNKRTLFIICLVVVCCVTIVWAANVKWSALDELTTIDDADVLCVIDSGTSKKITVINFFDTIDTFSELNTIVADKTLVNEEDAVAWDALGTFGLGITITTGDPFTLGANRIDNGSDLLDGEMIAADTIDDDSIDWADVTGVDITLTDAGAITSSGVITATTSFIGPLFDAAGAEDMDYGSVDVTDHTFVTDSTGTAEIVLPAGSIDGTEILDDTIDSADYAAGSIDAEHLAADIISEAYITDDGIDSEHYNDGSIDAAHLAADVIDETKIADDGIDSEHYNAGSIDYEHLADDIISGAAAIGTFESGDTFLILEAGVGLREADYDDLPSVATAYDDIADPDAASSITFADGETVTWATSEDSAGSFFLIQNSDADLAANTYLVDLDYSVDDNQANADYLKCQDAGGVVLTIQQNGDLASTGTIEGATITEGGVAVYSNDEMDASSELLAIFDDETGTGVIVFATAPSFTTSINAVSQASIGTTSTEFGDIFIGDGKAIKLGDDQDVTLTHVADTGVQMELDDSIMFGDTAVFIESDDDGYLDLDADIGIRLNAPVTMSSNIKGEPKHMVFNIINPLATQTEDNEICLWPAVPAALTVTKIQVTLDASGNEVAGDLKWADAFIGLAGATVINVFDTSSGVLVDSTITAGSVASGKCIYIAFDSAPNTAIKQMCVDITYDFD